MGSCTSSLQRESRNNSPLDIDLRKERIQANGTKKILLLGSGGSGKSTIFKQLRQIYGEPLTRVERRQYVTYIHEQCINQMRHALDVLNDFQEENTLGHKLVLQNYGAYVHEEKESARSGIPDLSETGMEAADYIQSLHHTKYKLNDEIVTALKMLWDEPAIKKMYELRNITGIEDSSQYFWDILDTIADPSYIPDLEDTLLVRKRTTGTLVDRDRVHTHCIPFCIHSM